MENSNNETSVTLVIPEPKKRLVRKRRTDLALETALRDAAAACERGADPATKGLIQTRLNILNQQLTRERNEKVKHALAEAERLRAENEKLKAELTKALSQIEHKRRAPVDPNETLEAKTARLLQTFDGGQF